MISGHPRRVGAVAAAFVLAAIAGGCGGAASKASNAAGPIAAPSNGGTAPPAAPAAPTDGSGTDASACHLLTAAEVTTAMRQPMKVTGGAGAAICSYSATTDPSIALAVQTFATRADMSLYTQIESSGDHVDGLGDDAFWNSTLDLVFVRKGDRAFVVTSPSLANLVNQPQASKSAMVDLGRIVLGRF